MGRMGAEDPSRTFPAEPPGDGALSEEEILRLLRQAATEVGARAWIVGGYVRDQLLGRAHPDMDVVVEDGKGFDVAGRFAELAGAREPAVFERFGTAQVTLPGHLVEFVSARAESYDPGSRKPDVRPATLEEDLRRRDFTVNTLLMDLDGQVHDPLGTGLADLEARLLRTPADPVQTFTDDPLRMMRVSERPKLALELLDEASLLEVILPEVTACKGVQQGGYHTHDVFGHTLLAVAATPPDLVVRLAALFHDVGKPATAGPDGTFVGHDVVGADVAAKAMERLRFPQKEIDAVAQLVRLHLRPVFYSSEWTDGAVRRLARDAGPLLRPLMELARADIAASAYPHPEKLDELQAGLDAVLSEQPSRLEAPVNGEDIMRVRGIRPGPEVGRIKLRLTELVLDGAIEPTREAVLVYLKA